MRQQKHAVHQARVNLDRQLAELRQKERRGGGRSFPAAAGARSSQALSSSSRGVGPGRGAHRGRGAFRGRGGRGGGACPQARSPAPGSAVNVRIDPPAAPIPFLAEVMAAVKTMGDRMSVLEEREQQRESSLLPSSGSSVVPVASSTPRSVAPPHRSSSGAASGGAPPPQFGAVDFRVSEGSVPVVHDRPDPAQ